MVRVLARKRFMSTEIRLSDISGEMVSDLRKRYGEPQRAYHTWTHIEKLLALFDEVKSRLHDPPAVLYAILENREQSRGEQLAWHLCKVRGREVSQNPR